MPSGSVRAPKSPNTNQAQSVHCVLDDHASVSTHLEQIHFVPAPTGKEDLIAVQLAQLGVKRSFLEDGCIHVCREHERVGVSAMHTSVRSHLRRI